MSKICTIFLMSFLIFLFLIAPRFTLLEARRSEELPRNGGTLRIKAFTDNFNQGFDPATNGHYFLLEQIYDGLVRLDKKLNVVPALAEYWTISEDGRQYTFYLRRGVRFHHGRELTAEDVKFSLERLVDRKTGGPFYQYFVSRVVGAQEFWEGKASEVAGYKVRDRYTFEIEWKNTYVSGLSLMSMFFCKILPRDMLLAQGKNFFHKPLGTGPFRFAHWLRSPKLEIVGVRLERNNAYWSKKPYLEALEFSPHFTQDNFLDRDIDIIPYLSERLSRTDCQVIEGDFFNIYFLGMSCHLAPLDKPIVRKAISQAIDKSKVALAAFRFDQIPQVTSNFVPPKLPGFFPVETQDNFDREKAWRVLRQEGFSLESPFPPLAFYINRRERERDSRIYQELRDQLEEIGIPLKQKYYESIKEVKSSKEPYLIPVYWLMDFPDPENIVEPLFSSQSDVNIFRYANPKLDELLQKAEAERSLTERIALFHKIEMILQSDIPALPLFSYQQRLAVQPYVKGIEPQPLGFYFLDTRQIWLDKRE